MLNLSFPISLRACLQHTHGSKARAQAWSQVRAAYREQNLFAGLEGRLAEVRAGRAAVRIAEVTLRGGTSARAIEGYRAQRGERTFPHAEAGISASPPASTVTLPSARPHVQFAQALRPPAPTCAAKYHQPKLKQSDGRVVVRNQAAPRSHLLPVP